MTGHNCSITLNGKQIYMRKVSVLLRPLALPEKSDISTKYNQVANNFDHHVDPDVEICQKIVNDLIFMTSACLADPGIIDFPRRTMLVDSLSRPNLSPDVPANVQDQLITEDIFVEEPNEDDEWHCQNALHSIVDNVVSFEKESDINLILNSILDDVPEENADSEDMMRKDDCCEVLDSLLSRINEHDNQIPFQGNPLESVNLQSWNAAEFIYHFNVLNSCMDLLNTMADIACLDVLSPVLDDELSQPNVIEPVDRNETNILHPIDQTDNTADTVLDRAIQNETVSSEADNSVPKMKGPSKPSYEMNFDRCKAVIDTLVEKIDNDNLDKYFATEEFSSSLKLKLGRMKALVTGNVPTVLLCNQFTSLSDEVHSLLSDIASKADVSAGKEIQSPVVVKSNPLPTGFKSNLPDYKAILDQDYIDIMEYVETKLLIPCCDRLYSTNDKNEAKTLLPSKSDDEQTEYVELLQDLLHIVEMEQTIISQANLNDSVKTSTTETGEELLVKEAQLSTAESDHSISDWDSNSFHEESLVCGALEYLMSTTSEMIDYGVGITGTYQIETEKVKQANENTLFIRCSPTEKVIDTQTFCQSIVHEIISTALKLSNI